jgi:hypothetical protein
MQTPRLLTIAPLLLLRHDKPGEGRKDVLVRVGIHDTLLIGRAADLDSLIRSGNSLRASRRPSVKIRVAKLSNSETLQWEQKLERFREACGCSHAAVAMGLFAVSFVAYVLYSGLLLPGSLARPTMIWTGALFFLGLIISTIMGKAFGLWAAGRGYRKTCCELKSRLERLGLAQSERTLVTDWQVAARSGECFLRESSFRSARIRVHQR